LPLRPVRWTRFAAIRASASARFFDPAMDAGHVAALSAGDAGPVDFGDRGRVAHGDARIRGVGAEIVGMGHGQALASGVPVTKMGVGIKAASRRGAIG